MNLKHFLILATVMVSGCNPLEDNRFRTEGPGVDLMSSRTKQARVDLTQYLNELCLQGSANINSGKGCAPFTTANHWRELVFTGFNDIDLRCDDYMRWLDQIRSEKQFVNEGSNAIKTLLGGVLGIAVPETIAINYINLALGFATDTYNSYHNTILLGMESSTVKTIVYERRAKLRQEFRDDNFSFKPDAVYALRTYLRACMPQTIVMDVNTFTRSIATGDKNPLDASTERDAAGVMGRTVPKSTEKAGSGTGTSRGGAVFNNPAEGFGIGVTPNDIRAFQRASCIGQDGKSGPATKAAIRMFRLSDDGVADDGPVLTRTELQQANPNACKNGAKNYFEKVALGDKTSQENLVRVILTGPLTGQTLTGPMDFSNKNVRKLISDARAKLGDKVKEDPGLVATAGDQITPALYKALEE